MHLATLIAIMQELCICCLLLPLPGLNFQPWRHGPDDCPLRASLPLYLRNTNDQPLRINEQHQQQQHQQQKQEPKQQQRRKYVKCGVVINNPKKQIRYIHE